MQYYDYNEFLRLSAVLNYHLSAKDTDWDNILRMVLGGKSIPIDDRKILLEVLHFINGAYGQKRRILGPLSVIHPIRATALLARTMPDINMLDLMTELLHDNFEDNEPMRFKPSTWFKSDSHLKKTIRNVPDPDQVKLLNRLSWLTKHDDETYYRYIGRLLDEASNCPAVIRVKLADRLDNTLDMRIDFQDPISGIDFFETIFQILFIDTYKGYRPHNPHPPRSAINGSKRLFQLFKNIVLMSLIRQRRILIDNDVAQDIFINLAHASIRETQRITLHIFGYHEPNIKNIREMILNTMDYVQSGGTDLVTSPTLDHRLDGLLISRFDDPSKEIRQKKLEHLYRDKPLMVEAAIAFMVVFLSFLNDPDFYVHGISEKGVRAEDK